jgi:hypothetical protein
MIYSIVVGGLLGAGHVAFLLAISLILGLVTLKGVAEILLKKNPIVGTPSPYVLYQDRLRKSESFMRHAWLGYLFQMMLFGCGFGLAAYGICYFVF